MIFERVIGAVLTINHRLRGSASPVLTATHHSYRSLAWLSDFFDLGSGGQTPQRTFTQNGSNDVYSRKSVPFAVKIATFHTPDLRAPKRSKFSKFLDLELFRSIWPLKLEVQKEITPYSSSEPNESDIVNRQSGGEKLKYVLKFYIGVHITWYRACAMTVQHCVYEYMMFGAEYLGNRYR